MKSKKRKPDLRRIRTSHTYTVPEVADALDRSVATVRSWIRNGLPTLDGNRPVLVLGSDLKEWLADRWRARRRPCARDEFYCFRCHEPRRAMVGSVEIVLGNARRVSVTGRCEVCGTRINRVGSRARLVELEETFRPFKRHMQRLAGCDAPGVSHTSRPRQVSAPRRAPDRDEPGSVLPTSSDAEPGAV